MLGNRVHDVKDVHRAQMIINGPSARYFYPIDVNKIRSILTWLLTQMSMRDGNDEDLFDMDEDSWDVASATRFLADLEPLEPEQKPVTTFHNRVFRNDARVP